MVGASLAGLPTAAALADRFDRVTVIERDALPPDGRPRTGVPQGRHGHVLLPSGLRELTALLPGFTDDLRAHGAHLLHVGEIRFHVAGDHLRLDDTELQLVGATRPLLESVVRSRVSTLPSVEITDGVDARGLVLDGGVRVTGLSVRRRDGGSATTLDADLVVDAGGRGSPSPRWLADAGIAPPDEERFEVGVHYATRLFRRRPDDLDGCRHAVVGVPPNGRRGGFAVAVEGDRSKDLGRGRGPVGRRLRFSSTSTWRSASWMASERVRCSTLRGRQVGRLASHTQACSCGRRQGASGTIANGHGPVSRCRIARVRDGR